MNILIIDDEEVLQDILVALIREEGHHPISCGTGGEGLDALEREEIVLVLLDLMLPDMHGQEVLRQIRDRDPDQVVVVITAYSSIEGAIVAMREGAFHYLPKPFQNEEVRLTLRKGLERRRLATENRRLRERLDQRYGFDSIIGKSKPIQEVFELIRLAAPSKSNILILGESGTGKELVAKSIHNNSKRKDGPFVTVNSGSMPPDLLESNLFGHIKGAFTGAVAHKKGKIEIADTGTLFLDEIGELPLTLQAKLLRLLQEREIEKIGATAPMRVDVRVVAATHRNLQAMVEDGEFREDLFYRLAVIPLELPPLRERPEDTTVLAQHFFELVKQRHNKPDLALSPAVLPHLCAHRWPGNVRELENLIERLVVLGRSNEITIADLPENLRRQRPPLEAIQLELPPNGISLEAVEKELILRALRKFRFNQSQAARYLDISRKTLIYRMEKFGIKEPPS
jgi:two-component system NtrC family response regulator